MEILINNNCDYEQFYRILDKSNEIGFIIIEKVDGFDSIYVDIEYKKVSLTLHYNIYEGIVIYPKNFDCGSNEELILNEIAEILKEKPDSSVMP